MMGGLILGVANLSACSLNNKQSGVNKEESSSVEEKNEELNEWQKEFLKEQGLPTEYSELNLTQQLSVEAIYEMIMYLEDKYGIGFEYNGYVRPQILESEHMYAYPEGGDKEIDTFTVTREDDGTLTDDYPNIAVRPYYEQMVTDYVKNYFNSDEIKVISKVTESGVDINAIITKDHMRGNVAASNKIFINSSVCNTEEISTFILEYSQWLNEEQLLGTNWVYLLNNDASVFDITESNYKDYFDGKYTIVSTGCSVQSDNRIQILD